MSSGGVILPVVSGGVTSINGDTGAVTIAAGSGIQVDTVGNTITVSNTEAGGSVTSVSVATANGLAGSVANPSTTPAITLSTTITGILQGNGTAISAATLGNLTDVGTDGIVVTGGTGAILGSGTSIAQHVADTTHNGYLSSTDWNTFNGKQAALTLGNLTDVGTDGIVVTGGTGSVVGTGTSLAQHVADTTHNGYLSSTDWNTFNGKQSALTLGNLTDVGTDGIVITGGTGSIIGTGTAIAQTKADATHNGYLSSTDWNTFNGKGAGSVTSVALVMPAEYAVSGSPVTTTGSLTAARPTLTATAKVANYTLLNTDYAIKVDNTSGAFAITMPSPSANASHIYIITNIGTGTNIVTVSPSGSETFGAGALAALHLTTIGESWTLMSDGTNWVILAHYAYTTPATFTVSISVASGSVPTKGTIVIDRAVWWREGRYMRVRWSYQQSAAGTSAGNSAVIQYNLPTGFTVDTTAQPASTSQFQSIGSAYSFFPSSATGPFQPSLYDSTHFCFWGGNTIDTPNNFNWSAVGTSVLAAELTVPITNWEP